MNESSAIFNDYVRLTNPEYIFNNQIFIKEIKGSNSLRKSEVMRLDAFSIFLVCRGEMHLNIDYLAYQLKKNMILTLIDLHITENINMSSDFMGYHILVSKDLLSESLRDVRSFPIPMEPMCTQPIKTISDNELKLLLGIIDRMVNYIKNENHVFQQNLVRSELNIFVFEIIAILVKNARATISKSDLNRKDKIIGEFIRLLLQNFKEKHKVSFYSNKLHITPEYLSKIMKVFSGKTVNKWICDALVAEAKILLRRPRVTVQQVADILNFSDQSSFSKFFKKHTGKSPLEYKNSLN
ncbi:MAG: AraC family transcriptional regulator [Prevotellaceae bacterium]|jgi:AraC-like DNA-binding protein|nr:AraC family transcriptional regulator [Prevotellaceae bacterium]